MALSCLRSGQMPGIFTQCSGFGELGIPVQGQGKPLEVKLFLLSFPRRVHMSRCFELFMFEVSLCYFPAECRILGWKSVLCRILVYRVLQRDPMTFPAYVLLFSFSLWNFLGGFISGRLKFHNDVPSGIFFSLYWTAWVVCGFLEINPLSSASFANIFFPFWGFFVVFFTVQKLLSLIRSHLFVFAFIFIRRWVRKDLAAIFVRVFCLCFPVRVL